MSSTSAIEQQLLHGVSRDAESSPRRRADSLAGSDDEGSDDEGLGQDGASGEERGMPSDHASLGPRTGPNTGVKGVRADAQRHTDVQRAVRADQVRAKNEQMEKMALGKERTWREDEADRSREAEAGLKPGQLLATGSSRDDDEAELAEIRQRRLDTLKSQAASNEARRKKLAGEDGVGARTTGGGGAFGHLREVGADQYSHAIDGEDGTVYVVVHIYVKHVHACSQTTSALSSLARMHTNIKFLQVRAGSIGFGGGGKDVLDEVEGDDEAEEVVPTLLMYNAGQLLANLVRIDLDEQWGEGLERDIRNILRRHGAPL